jgi:hypothetical protein
MGTPVNSREVASNRIEVTIMRNNKRFSVSLVLWLFFVATGSYQAQAPSPTTPANNPQGGNIAFGPIGGVTTPAAAMSKVLRTLHNTCGEKPQVGKVFKVRGTDLDEVFFTVVNHQQGNKQVAGMLIATPTGPNRIEAALIYDDASRFGSTVNPMLTKLFSEWHPGGTGQASGSASGAGSAPPAALHRVMASDNSATVGIPNGWNFKGSQGTMMISGPNSEVVGLNYTRLAANPSQRFGNAGGNGKIVFPSNVDPVRGFPSLFQQFWRVNGGNPDLRVANAQQVPGPNGQRCVHAVGHATLGGPHVADKDMPELEALLCTTAPGPMGNYMVTLSMSLIPPALADRERATVGAILSSFEVNQGVVAQQANAMAAPAIAQIHAIGQAATARYNATQAANDAQHAGYWAQQDSNARNGQSFNNYLLDQTVIQDNNMDGNGTVGHGTVWNSTADALVRANPNRYEIVDTPNFWQGVDY